MSQFGAPLLNLINSYKPPASTKEQKKERKKGRKTERQEEKQERLTHKHKKYWTLNG